jgi:serine/threonine-protein phosphatase 2A regulatory subunit B
MLVIYFHFPSSPSRCLDLIDIKPENMEELTEVITAVQCHPQQCNILTYSSSRGTIKVCDLRTSAVCSSFSKVYAEHTQPSGNKSFITDILNSISDIK